MQRLNLREPPGPAPQTGGRPPSSGRCPTEPISAGIRSAVHHSPEATRLSILDNALSRLGDVFRARDGDQDDWQYSLTRATYSGPTERPAPARGAIPSRIDRRRDARHRSTSCCLGSASSSGASGKERARRPKNSAAPGLSPRSHASISLTAIRRQTVSENGPGPLSRPTSSGAQRCESRSREHENGLGVGGLSPFRDPSIELVSPLRNEQFTWSAADVVDNPSRDSDVRSALNDVEDLPIGQGSIRESSATSAGAVICKTTSSRFMSRSSMRSTASFSSDKSVATVPSIPGLRSTISSRPSPGS